METLLIANLALTAVVGAVVAFVLIRGVGRANPSIGTEAADGLATAQRDEFSRTRLESAEAARALREEMQLRREEFESFRTQLMKSADATRAEAEGLRKEVRNSLQTVTTSLLDTDREQRAAIGSALRAGTEAIAVRTAEFQQVQKDQLQAFSDQLTKSLEATRSESAEFRKKVADSLRTAAETLQKVGNDSSSTQREVAESNAEQPQQPH